jgi:small subunit ribosomal protein S8
MTNDPIADLLTRIRNAASQRQRKVDVPPSNLKVSIVDLLKKNGFIRNYKLYQQDSKGVLRIYLKYAGKDRSIIQGTRRLSKPSRRLYAPHDRLPKVLGGIGVAIVSTSKGLMTDQGAREARLGGELLCSIW